MAVEDDREAWGIRDLMSGRREETCTDNHRRLGASGS